VIQGISAGRFTANHAGPLTVFIIGMRINKFHRVDKWLPVARAMQPMIAELSARPESGFLGSERMLCGLRMLMFVQYWRNFSCLEAYARDRNQSHWPAWAAFYRHSNQGEAVGIFHETYCLSKGSYETVYGNMPLFGLGKVAGVVPAPGARNKARDRMNGRI
jgi:hypothetical protein